MSYFDGDEGVDGSGNGSLDPENSGSGIIGNDGEILGANIGSTHTTGHFLAGQNSSRSGASANGTGGALAVGLAMSSGATAEVPTFHNAGKSLAFGLGADSDERIGGNEGFDL